MDEWILMGMAKQPQLGRRRGMEAQEIIVVIVIIVIKTAQLLRARTDSRTG